MEPGFTANRALYRHHQSYASATGATSPSAAVVPQRIDEACWIRAALGTSIRCINLGHSADVCTQVAIDLADSVCDF